MPIDRQPDVLVRELVRTYNDPRVHGRPGAVGAECVYVNATTGRAYHMVKQGDGDTAWEAVFTDGEAGQVVTADLADLAVTPAKLSAALAALIPGAASFSIAAQVGTARDVTIQLRDANLVNLATLALARVWISDAAGGAATGTVPDGGVSIQSGVSLDVITTNKVLDVISTAAGVIVVRITHAAAGTRNYFVNVAIGNMLASSAAVALTN